jgi:leucyl-tRNA synthetase
LTSGQKDLRRKLHQTIAKAGDDIERRYTFNTAIASVRELLNALTRHDGEDPQDHAIAQEAWTAVVLMLAPIVPHVCERLWEGLGHQDLLAQRWPEVDEAALEQDAITLVVQVNGKLRGRVDVAVDADQEAVKAAAMEEPNVVRFIEGKTIRKVIVVPGKLVNVVAT